MTTPPAATAPLPCNINAALLRLSRPPLSYYRFLYFQVGHPWNWELRLRQSDDALATAIHASTTEITVLHVDGAPAGFFEINRADPHTVDLAYFGMMPHVHGMGLGRWFLGTAVRACWHEETQAVTVNTCTLDHPAALPLYQRLGFQPVRQAPGRVRPLTRDDLAGLAASDGLVFSG